MKKYVITLYLVLMLFIPGISNALGIGEKAPSFEAPSTQGTVKLSDFEGKKHVVLALYYADFTPV